MNFFDKIAALRDIGPERWLAALAGILILFWTQKRRQLHLANSLVNRGFSRQPELPGETVTVLHHCAFLNKAIPEAASDIIAGEAEGIEWTLFNTAYSTADKEKPDIYRHTIACARVCEYSFPLFYLVSRRFYEQTGEVIDLDSVLFKNRQKFSKKYVVRADDQALAREMFSRRVLRYFEGLNGNFWIYTEGHIFVCCFLSFFPGEHFYRVLDKAENMLYSLLP